MGGVGSVNTVLLVSQDLRASFAANLVHGSQTGLINAPDTKFAFVSTPDGAWSTAKHEEIGVRRASDGMAVGLRKNGRASCRESGCQYVSISVVAVSLKKKK